MAWIVNTEKPCTHPLLPKIPSYYGGNEHRVGDVWECDDCGKRFTIETHRVWEGMQHDPYRVTRLRWSTNA